MSQAQPRPRRSRRESSRGAVVTDLRNRRELRQAEPSTNAKPQTAPNPRRRKPPVLAFLLGIGLGY